MSAARDGASAATLSDGRVLVSGGNDANGNPQATVEFLGAGTSAGTMIAPRSGHISVALKDGTVLLAGGTTTGGAVTNSAEIFNPSTGISTAIASLLVARSGATATLLTDGRVFIAGGQGSGGALQTTEIYDPAVGQFSNAAPMSSVRQNHAAALLNDGRVAIAGGSDGTNALNTIDIYDPAANSISPFAAAMAAARSGLSATTLIKGQVLLAGGTASGNPTPATEILDVTAGVIAPGPAMSVARTGHLALLLPNNNTVLMVSGTSASVAAEIYIPWQNAFAAFGTLANPRTDAAGGASGQTGAASVAGGLVSGTASAVVETIHFPMVKTDKPDYQPGDTATITGSGFAPNETVNVIIEEVVDIDNDSPITLSPAPQADANGSFTAQFPINAADLNVRFYLNATGQTSGLTAGMTFTDATTLRVGSFSSSYTFQLTYTTYATGDLTCGGTPTGPTTVTQGSSPTTPFSSNSYGSVKIQASTTENSGGSFKQWNISTGGTTTTNPVCVSTGANVTYTAEYDLPDLTVTKANSVGGSTTVNTPWTWTITVTNSSIYPATFPNGSTILSDGMSGTNITYGTPAAANVSGTTNAANINCSISGGSDLSCSASGADVTIAAGGSFTVSFTATASVANTYTNPASPKKCTVDPAPSGGAVAESNELNNDCAANSVTVTAGAPDLTVAKSHIGNFSQGQTGATYSIVVTNSGSVSTSGTVTVVDTLPAGLTATGISGTGWSCILGTLTCTRSDALAASISYPAIIVTVNVAANAASSVTNSATVSGGGETNTANDTATDPTTVTQLPDLTIAKSHSGNFSQGQTGATYNIVVTNSGGASTSGTVTVIDTLPTGLTATGISGTGWSCILGTLTCTRSDALAASISYPAIIVTVNVAANAASSVTNSATVSGGGETNTANDTATDLTTVTQLPDLTVSKTDDAPSGQVALGNSFNWTLTVTNSGSATATFAISSIILTDNLPTGVTYGSITVTPGAGVTGTISCPAISSSNLNCTAGTAVTIPAGASFTVSFSATPGSAGTYANPRAAGVCAVDPGGIVTEINEANNSCSDTVYAVAPPTISKAFSPTSIPVNGTSTLTITITNPAANPVALTGVGVVDNLPTDVKVAAIPNVGNTCGGTFSPAANAITLTLSGGSISMSSSCQIHVDVTATAAGSKVNTTDNVTSTNGGNGLKATATLYVLLPPTIGKAFTAASINIGTTTTLTFTLTNPNNLGVALTGVGFSDSLPPGLVVADMPGAVNNCGGTFTAVALATSVGLSSGTIGDNTNCTISVSVKGINLGPQNNQTGTISSTNGGTGTTSNVATVTVYQPTTTTVDAKSVQYSDKVTLTATVSPAGCAGTFAFTVNGGGSLSATYTPGTGAASYDYTDALSAGSYTIGGSYTADVASFCLSSTNTNTLTVIREDATVTPDPTNPTAVQVSSPGGTSGSFTLKAEIAELSNGPNQVAGTTEEPGDISKAVPVTCTLTPIGSGTTPPPPATAVITGPVLGVLTAACTFSNVPVNVYDVKFSIGGNYYQGSADSVVTIYDPSLGFTTGGGTLINPNTHNPANFGFNVKYLKNGNIQSSLLYIEHNPDDTVVMVKSNSMGSLAIVGNEGIFNGKATYQGVGNYTFQVIATDNGTPGANIDQFALQVNDPTNAEVTSQTFNSQTITGGNIQVPQPSKK